MNRRTFMRAIPGLGALIGIGAVGVAVARPRAPMTDAELLAMDRAMYGESFQTASGKRIDPANVRIVHDDAYTANTKELIKAIREITDAVAASR